MLNTIIEDQEDEPPPPDNSIDGVMPAETAEDKEGNYEVKGGDYEVGEEQELFEGFLVGKLTERPGEKPEEGLKIVQEGGDKSREVVREFLARVNGYAGVAEGTKYLH